MRTTFKILLFTFSSIAYGQNPFYNLYTEYEDGYYKEQFLSGKPKLEMTILNNLLENQYVSYFRNGQPQAIANFSEGLFNGETSSFKKSGLKKGLFNYRNDTLLGVSEYKYYNSKTIKSELHVDFNDTKNLPCWQNGGLSRITKKRIYYSFTYFIVNYNSIGHYRQFYKNGQLKLDVPMINGKTEGAGKSYYEDGSLEWDLNYLNGRLNGEIKKYKPDGSVEKIENYNNGKKE